MTYEEAVAMYPYGEVFKQIDDVETALTPAEYEVFIEQQVNAVPFS